MKPQIIIDSGGDKVGLATYLKAAADMGIDAREATPEEATRAATDSEIVSALKTGQVDHITAPGRIVHANEVKTPIDVRHRVFAPNKTKMLDRARIEHKSGALFSFQDRTRHAILLNGQHVRVDKKLSKAERKAQKRIRVAGRNALA